MLISLNDKIKVIRPEGKAVFPYSNSLYIEDEISILIDAGAGGKAYQGIKKDKVDIILFTHYHFDHINGKDFFPNAKLMAAEEELEAYKDQQAYYSFSGHDLWEELMGSVKKTSFASYTQMPDDVPLPPGFNQMEINGVLKDNAVFDLGTYKVQCIYTPGHTVGHYSFFLEKEGIVYSGDIDLSPIGPWYASKTSDFDDLILSVNKIKELNPRKLVTSHRKVFYEKDNIVKLLDNYIKIPLEKETKLFDFLSQEHSLDEIVVQEFANQIPLKNEHILFWTKVMILKHIKRLKKLGLVEELGLYRFKQIKR